jgi:HrpA-like RNA helicase
MKRQILSMLIWASVRAFSPNHHTSFRWTISSLPIDEVIPDVMSALQQQSFLVIEAPPGAT